MTPDLGRLAELLARATGPKPIPASELIKATLLQERAEEGRDASPLADWFMDRSDEILDILVRYTEIAAAAPHLIEQARCVEVLTELAARLSLLEGLLREVVAHDDHAQKKPRAGGTGYGLIDCTDNDGIRYPSAALAGTIARARAALQGTP